MTIDLGKLSTKAIIVLSLTFGLLILAALGAATIAVRFSYQSNQAFMIFGKEFGFGAGALQAKITELNNCQANYSKTITGIQLALQASKKENEQLKEENAKFVAQQQAKARHDASLWFPVSEITFNSNGTYSENTGGKSGSRKWVSPDRDLTLRLSSFDSGEVVLETNLPAPANRIRLTDREGIAVYTETWEYGLNLLAVRLYDGEIDIRVDRKNRTKI